MEFKKEKQTGNRSTAESDQVKNTTTAAAVRDLESELSHLDSREADKLSSSIAKFIDEIITDTMILTKKDGGHASRLDYSVIVKHAMSAISILKNFDGVPIDTVLKIVLLSILKYCENNDGVTIIDSQKLSEKILLADLNQDGRLDVMEMVNLISILTNHVSFNKQIESTISTGEDADKQKITGIVSAVVSVASALSSVIKVVFSIFKMFK